MQAGKLYFVKDEFYKRFKGYGLLENSDILDDKEHGRPCCYLFKYTQEENDIYWLIPISSKVSKYENEYQRAIKKYGKCDNISFGYVLGEKRAFLPQNLFPATEKYIDNIYLDKNTSLPINIPADLMAELNAKARKKIRYNQMGKKLGLSNALGILEELKKDI